jgi:hypothetical protein
MAQNEHHRDDAWSGLGHFLEGLVFPARPVDVIRHAERQRYQEKLHQEILTRVQKLPDREFRSPDELREHLDE